MLYRELQPSGHLSNFVKSFWMLEYENLGYETSSPIMPDGCVEIVFNLSDRFRRFHSDGKIETQPASIIVGQMQTSIVIEPLGNVRLFGIRFWPSGAFPFFRFEMHDLANGIEPLEAVWGKSVHGIGEQLYEAGDFEGQVAIAESKLLEEFSSRRAIDAELSQALNLISSCNGVVSVNGIAKDLGISERGLERRFRRFVGMPPKLFSRIVRFQKILQAFEKADQSEFLDTAYSFGYYDQSHFINDFRQFSGMSPSQFFQSPCGMTEVFFNTN